MRLYICCEYVRVWLSMRCDEDVMRLQCQSVPVSVSVIGQIQSTYLYLKQLFVIYVRCMQDREL